MRSLSRLLVLLATLSLALPAIGAAKPRVLAPPGDSAVSQYVEDVPTDSGSTPTSDVSGAPSGALTSSQRGRLDHLGADGRLLAAVVDTTTPPAPATVTALDGARPTDRASARLRRGHRSPGLAAGDRTTGDGPSAGDRTTGDGPSAGTDTVARSLRGVAVGSPASLVLSAAAGDGGGGLGILLPAIMLGSALGFGAASVRRRRQT
ncbi:MAG: hypothetical protein ACLP50_26815 [Solirubrobacteraceae bacterium]